MNILGIETSCDETAAAVVRDGKDVLSSVVHTQVALHRPYGGVVPEIASRSHVEMLPGIIGQAVSESGLAWNQIDAVAATYGPGLASSLLVGVTAGKALAMRLEKPFIGINHTEGHIYSTFLGAGAPSMEDVCPYVALVVSGGHTCLVRVEGLGRYVLLGQTIDDAAGEAFDKGANLLKLGFPGGPAIDKASAGGDPAFVSFPRGRQKKGDKLPLGGLDPDLCFSFSGLKTSLLYYLARNPPRDDPKLIASIAASYQEAIVDALVDRCRKAIRNEEFIAVAGGVSLNKRLRAKLAELARTLRIGFLPAEPRYCADNAAMIAGLAGKGRGISGPAAIALDISPSLALT